MPDERPDSQAPARQEERYKGTPVSPGIAVGPLLSLYADEHIVRKRRIRPEDVPGEITRFEVALLKTRQQIQGIRNQLAAPSARPMPAFSTRICFCWRTPR